MKIFKTISIILTIGIVFGILQFANAKSYPKVPSTTKSTQNSMLKSLKGYLFTAACCQAGPFPKGA